MIAEHREPLLCNPEAMVENKTTTEYHYIIIKNIFFSPLIWEKKVVCGR